MYRKERLDEYKDGIKISFQGTTIGYGQKTTVDKTSKMPGIEYDKVPGKYYTVIMVDPDAPSPTSPTFRYFLHVLIVNQSLESSGDIINEYTGPSPPIGIHRYYICILEQKKFIKPMSEYERKNFPIINFASEHDLNPIHCTKFLV